MKEYISDYLMNSIDNKNDPLYWKMVNAVQTTLTLMNIRVKHAERTAMHVNNSLKKALNLIKLKIDFQEDSVIMCEQGKWFMKKDDPIKDKILTMTKEHNLAVKLLLTNDTEINYITVLETFNLPIKYKENNKFKNELLLIKQRTPIKSINKDTKINEGFLEINEITLRLKVINKIIQMIKEKISKYMKCIRKKVKLKIKGKVIHERGNSLIVSTKREYIKPFSIINVKAKDMRTKVNDYRTPKGGSADNSLNLSKKSFGNDRVFFN